MMLCGNNPAGQQFIGAADRTVGAADGPDAPFPTEFFQTITFVDPPPAPVVPPPRPPSPDVAQDSPPRAATGSGKRKASGKGKGLLSQEATRQRIEKRRSK